MNINKQPTKQVQNNKVNDSNIKNNNKELQKLVQNNKHFEFLSTGKIKCILTHHEILPTLQDFNNYLNGRSYKNALENDIEFTQFEPYIVQHKSDKNKLFCNLTRQNISKKKSVVLKHVNGKRYKYYLSKYLEEQAKEEQQDNQEDNQDDNNDVQNELEELNNLINDDNDDVEVEQPKKSGILKGGKKINKKKIKQQQQQQIEIEQTEQNKQKKQQQDGKQTKKLKNKQQQKVQQ